MIKAGNRKSMKKLQKNNTKKLSKRGGGFFTTDPKRYTDIVYRQSTYKTSKLKCKQCDYDVFNHHTSTFSSRTRAFLTNSDAVLGNGYNIFTCTKCGYMMNYSGSIKYNSTKV